MNSKAKTFIEEYIDFLKSTDHTGSNTEKIEIVKFIRAKVIKDWAKELIRQDKKSVWIKSYIGDVIEYSPMRVTFHDEGLVCWFGEFISDTEFVRFMDYGKTWSFDKEDLK